MDKEYKGLDRLCLVYEQLNDEEKGKVIKLSEGLLKSQNVMNDDKRKITGKVGNHEPKNK